MVPSSPLQLLHVEVETLQGLVVEEGGTGGGGGRAGLGGDLVGKLVHLFLTLFIIFSCFMR